MDVFKGKGTPGIGDAMMYMNIAHRYAHDNDTIVELQLHWEHDEDFNYHFEDPETIIEKIEYLHKFYYENHRVIIKHFFNSTPDDVWYYRMLLNDKVCIHHEEYPGWDKVYLTWFFDPKFKKPDIKNKVVLYRSKFNAEPPRKWKRFTNDKVIDLLNILEYNIVEIDYRTPIREVMWHINTADFVIGYDGMWHHVAQMFFKPRLILSSDAITRKTSPGACTVSNGQEHNYLNFIRDLRIKSYKHMVKKSKQNEKKLKDKLYEHRQSGY